ncbi:MAG: hypothetical protein KAR38_12685 [Calditrichia bacterium]|nr:hypothetical protein [Calditrichia bacterium]
MSEFQKHLYMVLYPNEALIASELSPAEFGMHYAVGSPRHFIGKTVFAEIDIDFRDEYFHIDDMLKETKSNIPGEPKKTKFISSYRVLEHMDLKAIQKLHLVTVDGQVLDIAPQKEYKTEYEDDRIRIYQEICPIHLLVGANLTPPEFGNYVVNEYTSKGAPKLFFTKMNIDVKHIINENIIVSPITNINPGHLKDCFQELKNKPDKKTKTISLASSFYNMSYAKIKQGFWIVEEDNFLFFPFPSPEELEEKNYDFYRSVYKVYQ